MGKCLMREVKDDGVQYEKPKAERPTVIIRKPSVEVKISVQGNNTEEDEKATSEGKRAGGKQLLTEG